LTAYGRWAINGYSPQLGNEMSNEGDEPAGELLWQQAREKYEDPASDLKVLAESLGVNRAKLIVEARNRGWKLRWPKKNTGTRATIQRFKDLLQKRLAQLEGEIDAEVSSAANEREIRAANILVRTLEKVLELERKDRTARARKRKERRKFDDAARDELARRLTALHGERGTALSEPIPVAVGSSGSSEGLAELGQAQPANPA